MKKILFLLFFIFSAINLECMDFDDDSNMSGYDGDEEIYENEEHIEHTKPRILIAKKIMNQISQSCPASPVKRDLSSLDLSELKNELKKVLHESLPGTPNRKRRFEEKKQENQYQSEDDDNDIEIILENENGETHKRQRLHQEN